MTALTDNEFEVYVLIPMTIILKVDETLWEESTENPTAEDLAEELGRDGKHALLSELFGDDDIQVFVVYKGEEAEVHEA